jgi:G:T-mismatch repair DNA endonuclease (very short patch repair protein)
MNNDNIDPKDRTAYWTAHIDRQQTEKLSKRAYCKKEGIGYASFLRWESRLVETPASGFIEIKSAKIENAVEIVILAGNGIKVVVGGNFNAERLVRIVQALVGPA